jgi:hypothetical protein
MESAMGLGVPSLTFLLCRVGHHFCFGSRDGNDEVILQ